MASFWVFIKLTLDVEDNSCNATCPRKIAPTLPTPYLRSPGSSTRTGICNYTCDPEFITPIPTPPPTPVNYCENLDLSQQADFKNNLICNPGKTRIGYRCYDNGDKGIITLISIISLSCVKQVL